MIRMISRENKLGLGNLSKTYSNIFLKLVIDGDLKLFNYYFKQLTPATNTSGGMRSQIVTKNILQKGNEALIILKTMSFRKDMIAFFNDCPDLSKKIENKEFRKRDLESITDYYNSNCR